MTGGALDEVESAFVCCSKDSWNSIAFLKRLAYLSDTARPVSCWLFLAILQNAGRRKDINILVSVACTLYDAGWFVGSSHVDSAFKFAVHAPGHSIIVHPERPDPYTPPSAVLSQLQTSNLEP
jgi:hypothetical protein